MSEKLSRAETADARRKHIIETAAICFIEQGFHQTGIRDIAKRAGVSLGNIYNHFGGKTELIAAIATLEAEDLAELQEGLTNNSDPLAALETFVERYLKLCSQPEYSALTIEILAEAMRNPVIVEGFLTNRDSLLSALEDQIAAIRNLSGAKPDISDRDCAKFTLDLIEGLAMRIAFSERKPSKRELNSLKIAVKHLL
ncbi:MAG: TetR/AcrR family transcriptional regulator [Roseibium sp.]|uniref:TetR/AcrR family transcriptional regulator n=1 Tax=Roseibium sp. TaxID=1936156 RepID=UPI00263423AF|nr:TetR/AcrR family transcriptional regulator [Roseibium sp.]MCV0424774.1 TetR/AcrR family transcriptional regulator [Roseibium sp.]